MHWALLVFGFSIAVLKSVILRRLVLLSLLMPSRVLIGQFAPKDAEPSAHSGQMVSGSLQVSQSAPAEMQGTSLVLSVMDVVGMAEENSPRLHEALAASQRVKAAAHTARAYTNPSLEVFEGHQSARPIATPGVPGLLQHYAAYQAIEIPAERRARQRVADAAVTSSEFGQSAIMLSVTADAKRAFYNALRRRDGISHAQANLQLVLDLQRRVTVEVNVGEKGRLELARAQAELARAEFTLQSAKLEYANAIALLRLTIAAPPEANLDPRGTLEPSIVLPPLEQLRAEVLRTHPAVAQSQADIQKARDALGHERSLRIPQPTAFAEFENQPDLRFWRAGITVPIPLWDRRRGQIEEAKATISQSAALLDQRRLELISALERAYEQYQLADQQTTSLESGSLRAAESAVDAAKAAYRFGERGIVEVLDAQRVLQSVREDLLNAQYARQSALVDLEELGAVASKARP